MRQLLIATASVLLLSGAGLTVTAPAYAQSTMGAQKSHEGNPQNVPKAKRTNKNAPAMSKRDNPNPPGPVQQRGGHNSGPSTDQTNQNPRTNVK